MSPLYCDYTKSRMLLATRGQEVQHSRSQVPTQEQGLWKVSGLIPAVSSRICESGGKLPNKMRKKDTPGRGINRSSPMKISMSGLTITIDYP